MLETGTYIVRPRITARRLDASHSVNNTILANSRSRQEKLMKVAQSYDLAHAKVAGWRAINEAVQSKKLGRLGHRKASLVPVPEVQTSNSSTQSLPAPTLHTDENLGYDDWDAVIALGLRVLVEQGQASIALKRHQDEDQSEEGVQPPPGTAMANNESDEDDTAQAKDGDRLSNSGTVEDASGIPATVKVSDAK
jgi:hypothetical protein